MSNSDDDFLPDLPYTPIPAKQSVKPKFIPPVSNKKLKIPGSKKPKQSSSTTGPSFFKIPENEFLKKKLITGLGEKKLSSQTPRLPSQTPKLPSQTPKLPASQNPKHSDFEPPKHSASQNLPLTTQNENINLINSILSILEEGNSTPSMLVSGLLKLAKVPATVPVLLSTGVGKVVRRLKDREGEVGKLAGKLVNKWRRIALQYDAETSTGDGETVNDVVIEEPVADHVQADKPLKAVVDKNWIIPLKQNSDPTEDPYEKLADAKREKVAKNELQRLSNLARTKNVTVPSMGVVQATKKDQARSVTQSEDLKKGAEIAKHSTASLGKFHEKLEKTAKVKGVKRKFESNSADGVTEKERSLGILESITNKSAKLNIEAAVNPQKKRKVMNSEFEEEEGKLQYKSYSPKKRPQRNSRTVTTNVANEEYASQSDLDDSLNDSDFNPDNADGSSSSEEDSEDEKDNNKKYEIQTSLKSSRPKTRLPSISTVSQASGLPPRSESPFAKDIYESDLKAATVPCERVQENIDSAKDALSETADKEQSNENELDDIEEREIEVATPHGETGNIENLESFFSCKKCKKKFVNMKCFMKHTASCGNFLYSCLICQKVFKSVRYLKIHVKKVHKEPRHSCQLCDLKFQTAAKLQSHIKTHAAAKCSVCEKSFKNAGSLRAHKHKVHSKPDSRRKEWSCTFCTKTLTSERGMRYHITLHKTVNDGEVSVVRKPSQEYAVGEDEVSARETVEVVDLSSIVVDTVADNIIVLH